MFNKMPFLMPFWWKVIAVMSALISFGVGVAIWHYTLFIRGL